MVARITGPHRCAVVVSSFFSAAWSPTAAMAGSMSRACVTPGGTAWRERRTNASAAPCTAAQWRCRNAAHSTSRLHGCSLPAACS